MFYGKGQFASCHSGPGFLDDQMHDLQVERFKATSSRCGVPGPWGIVNPSGASRSSSRCVITKLGSISPFRIRSRSGFMYRCT